MCICLYVRYSKCIGKCICILGIGVYIFKEKGKKGEGKKGKGGKKLV